MDHRYIQEANVILAIIFLSAVLLFLLGTLAVAILNLFTLRSLSTYHRTEHTPRVSILVPARNERESIETCIRSLLSQNYPDFEVCVLDDESSDNTWQILQRLANDYPKLKIFRGDPLPAGWLGKTWACHQLAELATGDILLFTDADTVHTQHTLSSAVAAMEEEKVDFITAFPHQRMLTFAEKLIMPFPYWCIMSLLPLSLAYKSRNPLMTAATGQFMMITRAAYANTGGFAAIKSRVVDDVSLCRSVISLGLKWRLLDGHLSYSVRQYRSLTDLVEGHTKNLFAEFDNRLDRFLASWLWLLIVAWAPQVSLIIGVLDGVTSPLLWLGAAAFLISLSTWLITYIRFGFPIYMTIFFPLSITAMATLAVQSLLKATRGKATWKGRLLHGI